ncbi:MAG TPA: LysM peptidoglycan-binding domain-containing protein [Actinomycetota bacterium]|nr:LysM peptidoglycan-binding domain-containing protein [Actinomycetota bacterium]
MATTARDLDAVVYRFPTGPVVRRRLSGAAQRVGRRVGTWILLLAVVAAVLLAGGPEAQTPAATGEAPKKVVLHAGETLWGLAERYAPASTDPRAYVDALLELNGLAAPPPPGTRLRLP